MSSQNTFHQDKLKHKTPSCTMPATHTWSFPPCLLTHPFFFHHACGTSIFFSTMPMAHTQFSMSVAHTWSFPPCLQHTHRASVTHVFHACYTHLFFFSICLLYIIVYPTHVLSVAITHLFFQPYLL